MGKIISRNTMLKSELKYIIKHYTGYYKFTGYLELCDKYNSYVSDFDEYVTLNEVHSRHILYYLASRKFNLIPFFSATFQAKFERRYHKLLSLYSKLKHIDKSIVKLEFSSLKKNESVFRRLEKVRTLEKHFLHKEKAIRQLKRKIIGKNDMYLAATKDELRLRHD